MKILRGLGRVFRHSDDERETDDIRFVDDFQIHPIDGIDCKVSEFASFLEMSVKYGTREILGVATGSYDDEARRVKADCLYFVPDARGGGSSVTLTSHTHRRLGRMINDLDGSEEVGIFHTHPGFTSVRSMTDAERGFRVATLLLGGKAAMVIVDPFSKRGVDVSAYAVDPKGKDVKPIEFRLVP